jgi:hypothetical protein
MPIAAIPRQLTSAPFTTAQAAAFGVSRSALRSSSWRHILRDVWAYEGVADTCETRMAAVRLVLPGDAFLCGLTAAWSLGIDVQDRRSERLWIGCRTNHRLRTRPGCLTREITVEDADLERMEDLSITTPIRTAFDCARWLSLIEAVVVADALAHRGSITAVELAEYRALHRGLRGVRRVDEVLALMDSLSESAMETRVRLLIVRSGLPKPTLQLEIRDHRDRFVARADFAYEVERVVVEYDGAFHWEQRRADDRRREAMRALGWTVIVLSASDYYGTPEATVDRIRRALAARGPAARQAASAGR